MLEVSERVLPLPVKNVHATELTLSVSMLAKFIVPPLLSTKMYVAELS